VSDCLLRWYAELLSDKVSLNEMVSLNEICLGVTGDGLMALRPACERLELSALVVSGGRFSLPGVRYDDSRESDWGGWLSAAWRDREPSR
jgi:hypothetical protein